MRALFVACIVWMLLCIGFVIYIEIGNRRFVENLAQYPQVPESGHSHGDPWKQIQDAEDDEGDTTPVVWFHIADPYERAEAYRAQLIKQFGEREEIHILAELKPKVWQRIPLTLDEMIRHAEAQMGLWPTEGTRSSIESFKEWKAEGREVNFQYGSVPHSTPQDEGDTTPVVWSHIADPYERAEAYRAQLIKQFGEREEIHILAELKPKVWQRIPLTLDEMIRHAEAQMGLWPTEGTRSSIESFKEWKAEGREANFQPWK